MTHDAVRRALRVTCLLLALLFTCRFGAGLVRPPHRSTELAVQLVQLPGHADLLEIPSTVAAVTDGLGPTPSDPPDSSIEVRRETNAGKQLLRHVSVVIAVEEGESFTPLLEALGAEKYTNVLVVEIVVVCAFRPDARLRNRVLEAAYPLPVKVVPHPTSHAVGRRAELLNIGAEAADLRIDLLVFLSPALLPLPPRTPPLSEGLADEGQGFLSRLAGAVGTNVTVADGTSVRVGIAGCTTLVSPTLLPVTSPTRAPHQGRAADAAATDGDPLVVSQNGYTIRPGKSAAGAMVKRLNGFSPLDARLRVHQLVDAVSLACLAVPRSAFYEAKGFGPIETIGDLAAAGLISPTLRDDQLARVSRLIAEAERRMSNINIHELAQPEYKRLVRECFEVILKAIDTADHAGGVARAPLLAAERARYEAQHGGRQALQLACDDLGHEWEVLRRVVDASYPAADAPALDVVQLVERGGGAAVVIGGLAAVEVAERMSDATRIGRATRDGASFDLFTAHGIAAGTIETALLKLPVRRYRSNPLRVVWDAFCCGCCGFSNEIVHFVFPLEDRQHVSLMPAPNCFCSGFPGAIADSIQRMRTTREQFVVERLADDEIVVWISHTDPTGYRNQVFSKRQPDYVVGRSMYEFTRVDQNWVDSANADCDEIWVPAEWVRQSFIASGVSASKLVIVPEAIDTHFFDPAVHSRVPLPPPAPTTEGEGSTSWRHWCNKPAPANAFKFYSNFKWEPRKGWDVLFSAFHRAFSPADAVSLYIHTHIWFSGGPETYGDAHNTTFLREAVLEYAVAALNVTGLDELPHFCFVTEDLTEVEVARVYNSVDAFVLPTRGEGWGLPAIQAMAMALPTITTAWGGQLEFLRPDVAFMIPVDAVEELPEDSVYRWMRGKKWGQPSPHHTARMMRLVFDHRDKAAAVGRRAREFVVSRFSEAAVTEIVNERLARIRRNVLARRLAEAAV